jgi:hypothetical protein
VIPHGPKKLSSDVVRDIAFSKEPPRELVRRYGITRQTVSRIRRGLLHSNITQIVIPNMLTAEQVIQARQRHHNGVRLTRLADDYGVPFSVIKNAVLGLTWQELNAQAEPVSIAKSHAIVRSSRVRDANGYIDTSTLKY